MGAATINICHNESVLQVAKVTVLLANDERLLTEISRYSLYGITPKDLGVKLGLLSFAQENCGQPNKCSDP